MPNHDRRGSAAPTIDRPAFDADGGRWARCTNCGMGWCEYREPVELFPGAWTTSGELAHECPEPMSYEQASCLIAVAAANGGMIVSQRQRAAIRLAHRRSAT